MSVLRLADHVSSVSVDVVAHLEMLLESAKSGELVTLYAVGATSDGGCMTAVSPSEDVWRDLAFLRRLEHRVLVRLDEC